MMRNIMRYVLALDQGTSSSRSVLVDENGKIGSIKQQEFKQMYPRPGWVEHDPEAIWKTQLDTAQAAIGKTDTSHIAAIGVTNQRETSVVWNRKTGKAIAPAIVWQDRRTAKLCDQLKAKGLESMFRKKTGLLLDPYFSGTKIRWLLDNVSGAKALAKSGDLAFGTIDTWLVWKLTGGSRHITDVTNASRTLMFDIRTGTWDDELLDALGIPKSILPDVVPCSGNLATTSDEWFGRELPITGIAGDQQAALFGQACFEQGMIKNTYGTGCFLLLNTGTKPAVSENKLLTTVAWRLGGQQHADQRDAVPYQGGRDGLPRPPAFYALEGSVFSGGSVVQWLRDGLGLIKKAGAVSMLAESVNDSDGVIMVPAFTGLGAPVWDASARGLIIGVTRGTTAAHIARAALESIAFQVADVVECMQKDSGISFKELRVDGGASANDLLMQMQADLLGCPVVRPKNIESTAMGAAFLAGLGAGIWASPDDIKEIWKSKRTFDPAISNNERKLRRDSWRKARDRAMNWAE
jgi:glycerol kinase